MKIQREKNRVMIDYVPAELRENKDWIIVFYFLNSKEKMQRHRLRVRKMTNKTLRRRYAKRICAEINYKLERGWNPEKEQEASRSFTLITEVINEYLTFLDNEVKKKSLRGDTRRGYTTYLNILGTYLKSQKIELYTVNFNRAFVQRFLDYVYIERKVTSCTYNNYLTFMGIFSSYMLKRGYLSKNPCAGISKKREEEKIRKIIPDHIRKQIYEYLLINNIPYLTLCMCTYFLLVRRTELTLLRVANINLDEDSVSIPAHISKNGKNEIVTIPKDYKMLLSNHIAKAKQTDYIFSKNDFLPGPVPLAPKKVSDEWAKMRRIIEIENKYQFYSLKDTGITNLLRAGVPSIIVRDQARHYDLSITEKYTPRAKKANKLLIDNPTYF